MPAIRHTLVILLACTTTAFAQTSGPSEPNLHFARFELGGGFLAPFLSDSSDVFPAVQVRLNLASQAAIELATHFEVSRYSRGLEGFYELRFRGRSRRSDFPVSAYVALGGLGSFETRHVNERRVTRPTGDVLIYPAHRFSRLTAPFALTGGGGANVRMTHGLTLDIGAEVVFSGDDAALAFQSAVMVPLGSRRR